ncbi:hypothetical protein [Erythrobacter crassostreae]|uniref:hypothetical protein n=1 Tax=Erythrobacter crassostreae TaxID=2828328 RepID=UPI002104812C|nr:hypothetical protein [Erythrobacter crassostrea]
MAEKQLFSRLIGEKADGESAPLGGNREEAAQRLQVGLFGIGAMVLLVGLASVIGNQAQLSEENAVPEAAPTTEPTDAPPQRDPLADAGVVPDILAEPSPTPTGEEPILPEQGGSNAAGPPDDTPAQ